MAAKYIFAVASAVFLALAAANLARGRGGGHPQTRTWMVVCAIFAVVCAWLFMRT